MRKHLNWSREDFEELSEDDQRIYREGLVHYLTSGKGAGNAKSSNQPPTGIVRRRI